jgi:hypothetical protein
MPIQKLFSWAIRFTRREYRERPAVEGIIIAAVVKFLTNATAHFDTVIECNREVAKIKEVM